MPRLGSEHTPLNHNSPVSARRAGATAYAHRSASPLRHAMSNNANRVWTLLVVVFCFYWMHHVLFFSQDYRAVARQELRASGLSEEQVEKYVPSTAAERRNVTLTRKNEMEQMKQDIAELKIQVEELKAQQQH